MNELKTFFNYLVTENLINYSDIVKQEGNSWRLTRDFAGLQTGMTFNTQQEWLDKISVAVIQQYSQKGQHLKAAV